MKTWGRISDGVHNGRQQGMESYIILAGNLSFKICVNQTQCPNLFLPPIRFFPTSLLNTSVSASIGKCAKYYSVGSVIA